MSLESTQIASLLSVISEEHTTTQTFEAIASSFHQFFNKQEYFKIGNAIVTLLQNRELIPHQSQRLVCIFLLFEMYRTDTISSNPFAPIFIHLLNTPTSNQKEYNWSLPKLSQQEKYFVSQLIISPTKDLLKKTATQIIQMDTSMIQNIDISGLQVSIVEKQSEMPFLSKVGVPCILSDYEINRYGFDNYQPSEMNNMQKQTIDSLLVGPDAPFRQSMKPEFIRLAPPLHIADDEFIWLNPNEYEHELVWANIETSSDSTVTVFKNIMAKAFKGPLQNNQQQILYATLAADPKIVNHSGLTPSKLPALVEQNPAVAIEILLKLTQSSQISEYLRVIINMEMSVHSMEVVNRLTTALDIPTDFLLFYVSNCIANCENIKDKSLQNRSVRLLCVFLQSLIRNKILDAKDLVIEVQPFCIEFSRINEANALYRLLKHMENDSVHSPQSNPTPEPTLNDS